MRYGKLLGLAALGAVAGVLFLAGVALAGRPLNTNDTEPVEPGMWQIEASGAYEHDSSYDHYDYSFTLAHGIMAGLDLGIGFGGQFERIKELNSAAFNEEGLGDLTVTPRWKFLEQSGYVPGQAVSFTVKFPTADHDNGLGSGEMDYDLTWIATEKIGDKVQIDANIGYLWIGEPEDDDVSDIFHYGVAVEYQLFEPVQWVAEVFGERELTSGGESAVLFNTGLRWAVCEGLSLDVAGGSGISGEAPDFFATAGLTWVFGPEKKEKGN